MKQISVLVTFFFFLLKVYSQEFITRWDLIAPVTDTIKFTIGSTGPVNYTWESIPAGSSGAGVITGSNAVISGLPAGSTIRLKMDPAHLTQFQMYGPTNYLNLKDVEQWGAVHWTSMERSFYNCIILVVSATDIPDLNSVTSTSYMFYNCMYLIGPNNIGSWNTQSVLNMSNMFAYTPTFNQPIGNWNTSSVKDMSGMFHFAHSFNQPIGNWNTAQVQNMSAMFNYANDFNQDIGAWNTGSVRDMSEMFLDAGSFNHNIGTWNTGSVLTMKAMFRNATSFNQSLGSWNTSSVNDMSEMFYQAVLFNQDIGDWNTGSVQDMSAMFDFAGAFNQDIGDWNTGSVRDMNEMFRNSLSFNQDIGNWNTSTVTNMRNMFNNAMSFNQDIGNWDTGAVKDMYAMFTGFPGETSFNQNIGNWNVSAVENMAGMFGSAKTFNQDLGDWNVSAAKKISGMFSGAISFNQDLGQWQLNPNVELYQLFDNSGMDCGHYSSTLSGWRNNSTTPNGITLGATNIHYETWAAADRDHLIHAKGWHIIGDALCFPTSLPNTPSRNLTCFIHPNPVKDQAILQIPIENGQHISVTVYNSVGSIVLLDKIYLYPEDNSYRLNVVEWPIGVYVVRTNAGNTQCFNRIIVSR